MEAPARFVERSEPVEAIRWVGPENTEAVLLWLDAFERVTAAGAMTDGTLMFVCLGEMRVLERGWWVVKMPPPRAGLPAMPAVFEPEAFARRFQSVVEPTPPRSGRCNRLWADGAVLCGLEFGHPGACDGDRRDGLPVEGMAGRLVAPEVRPLLDALVEQGLLEVVGEADHGEWYVGMLPAGPAWAVPAGG